VVNSADANNISFSGNGFRNFNVMLIYMAVSYIRTRNLDIHVLDEIGKYLFFVLILDFTLEGLDQIHRIYEAEESFETIKLLVEGKLYLTLFISQDLLYNHSALYACLPAVLQRPDKSFVKRSIF